MLYIYILQNIVRIVYCSNFPIRFFNCVIDASVVMVDFTEKAIYNTVLNVQLVLLIMSNLAILKTIIMQLANSINSG